MTTTVTTSTTSSISVLGLGAVVTLVIVLLLIATLISKEIMTSVLDQRAAAVNRVLSVVAVPMIVVFGFIILTKLIPTLG